jgi:hypothetical protein
MAMTVKQLKEVLAGLPDDMLIVISKDAEGNDYSPLSNLTTGEYTPDSTWRGEFYPYADEEGTEFLPLEECNSACLWPGELSKR